MVPQTLETSEQENNMILASAILAAALAAEPQTVSYSLPQTVIVVEISATREQWEAGPYSQWAEELLGIEAVKADSTAYSISGIDIRCEAEADQSRRYSLRLSEGARPVYLSMTRQGLVAGKNLQLRNGSAINRRLSPVEAPRLGAKLPGSGNMKKEAQAAAKRIAELRQARYDILIGNTDATYSGDALRAAVEDLRRMEDELMLYFTGTYSSTSENYTFEIVPSAEGTAVYEAFCLLPGEGIVPAGSVDGIPYYLEVDAEPVATIERDPEPEPVEEEKPKKKKKKNEPEPVLPSQYITYRIPAMCQVRLSDGEKTIAELRLPVYQLGIEEQYPIYN